MKMTRRGRMAQKLMYSGLGFALVGCRASGTPNHSPRQTGRIRDCVRYRENGEVSYTIENSRGLWSVPGDTLRVAPLDLQCALRRVSAFGI